MIIILLCCLDSGDVYEGEIKQGLPHGHGKLKFADGSYYRGRKTVVFFVKER